MTVDLVPQVAGLMLDCLCSITSANPNPPGQCCLRVGTQVAHDADLFTDLCCEGLAYVRLGQIFPTTNFPNPDTVHQAVSGCGIVSWGVEFEAGIIRCVPVGTDDQMPTCEEWTAAAGQNFYDAQALRQVGCCLGEGLATIDAMIGMSIVVGPQTQGDPLGGCVQRSVIITVQIPNCDC